MPANYIVINSKFKPFSYAEMLQPVQMATVAHQDIENQYAELATKANVWEEMANEQTDPYAYKMYKTYSNDLEEQANQLAKEGLTPASRQNMLKMRQRYSSDIVPIEQAYKRRQELIDEQRKLLAQDNTLMFNKNASMLSLDDLIRNPQFTYQSYSGATLTKQVGTAAQNLAKEMRENPRKWRSILGNQYFETIMHKGYRPEEIIQVLQNDPNASSVLKGIVEDAVGSSNIASWGDQATLDRAYDYARQGLWSAVGETLYETLVNKDSTNPRDRNPRSTTTNKSRLPDVTSYFFEKSRKEIPNLLDKNGKLKYNLSKFGISSTYRLDSKLFNEEGKFTEPKKFGPYSDESAEAIYYYNKINDILLDNGFSQEVINSMNKDTIEANLRKLMEANKNDALGRDIYRFSLDSEASTYLISKLKNRGLKMKEISSMRDGQPQYGGSTDIELEDGEAVDLMYDPVTREFISLYNGKYYEVPRGMISNDMYNLLDSYSSEDTQTQLDTAIKTKEALMDKYTKTGSLSDRELEVLDRIDNLLLYWDNVMGTAGDNFVKYIGKDKVN